MPSASSTESPNSQGIADLLSEARHLITRERTTEDDNLLQIQQVIEAAQRELRRLRIHEEVETFRSRQEPAEIGANDTESRNSSTDSGEGSPGDGSGGIISAMATTGQINIIRPGRDPESGGETRDGVVQPNTPLTELDLYLGHTTAWAMAGLGEVLQQLPEHGDTWGAAEASGMPLIQRESNRSEQRVPNDGTIENGLRSNNDGVRPTDERDFGMEVTRREVRNTVEDSPSTEGDSVDRSGNSLIYTDLSRLHREQSFINFTDRRVGRATSSNALDPGNILDRPPGDGDSWAIRSTPATQQTAVAENEEESNEMSEEDLGELTPLPTPPQPAPASQNRETASFSSTGATAGTEGVLEKMIEKPTKELESPFTKERRAGLMAAMSADITRYAQEREWAFYQDNGYCLLPRTNSPGPIQDKAVADRSTNRQPGTDGEPELRRRFRSLQEARRAREEAIRARFPRRTNNRATLPAQLPQQRQSRNVHDLTERFLQHMLSRPWATRTGERRERFDERFVQPEVARYRYSLLLNESTEIEAARVEFDQSMVELTDQSEGELMWLGGGGADDTPVRGQPPIPRLILLAVRDGLDIREGILIVWLWTRWSSNMLAWDQRDVEGFLPLSVMLFWVALRRGWGSWIPSRGMLEEARSMLLLHTRFNHSVALPNMREGSFSISHQEWARFVALVGGDVDNSRAVRILVNWTVFVTAENLDSAPPPAGYSSTEEFRLDRLERLIIEERVVNARRRVRGPIE
jgi:hypothetical protein